MNFELKNNIKIKGKIKKNIIYNKRKNYKNNKGNKN